MVQTTLRAVECFTDVLSRMLMKKDHSSNDLLLTITASASVTRLLITDNARITGYESSSKQTPKPILGPPTALLFGYVFSCTGAPIPS